MCYFNIPIFLEINVWLTCHFHTLSLCCCRAVIAELRVLLGNTEVYLGGCIRQSAHLQFQGLEITHETWGVSPGFVYIYPLNKYWWSPGVCREGRCGGERDGLLSCQSRVSLLQASLFSETQETSPPSFVLTIPASLLIGFVLTCHRKTPSKWGDRIPPSGSLPSRRKRGPLPWQHPSPRPDGRTLMHPALALSFMCLSLTPRGAGRDTTRAPIKSEGQLLWFWRGQQSHKAMLGGEGPFPNT